MCFCDKRVLNQRHIGMNLEFTCFQKMSRLFLWILNIQRIEFFSSSKSVSIDSAMSLEDSESSLMCACWSSGKSSRHEKEFELALPAYRKASGTTMTVVSASIILGHIEVGLMQKIVRSLWASGPSLSFRTVAVSAGEQEGCVRFD